MGSAVVDVDVVDVVKYVVAYTMGMVVGNEVDSLDSVDLVGDLVGGFVELVTNEGDLLGASIYIGGTDG